MRKETLIKRLREHKPNHLEYWRGDLHGMVQVWWNEGYVVTWEECHPGDEWNEFRYTRDEQYRFESIEQFLQFVESSGLEITAFAP